MVIISISLISQRLWLDYSDDYYSRDDDHHIYDSDRDNGYDEKTWRYRNCKAELL